MRRLAIVTTHPIQYNAPWFQLLQKRGNVELKVFYTWSQSHKGPKFDPDFGKIVEWDLPLLEGYAFEFVENISKNPGSHHFNGIDNPTLNVKIKEWQPDAILVIGWSYKSHLACLRYFSGKVKIIFRGDSTLLDEKIGFKKIVRRLFLCYVYRHIDYALCVGINNKKYFQKHGIKESQLIFAPHAVDNDRFAASTSRFDLKNKVGIKPTDFVVLFAGKLEKKKNPFYLFDLAEKLHDPQIVFLFVGNGHLEEDLKRKALSNARIKFLDFQNQTIMPAVYAIGNVFILPSIGPSETWGLAANEAMASGLPLILSCKVGGAIDLINQNGIVFDLNDQEAVAEYVTQLKNSKNFYHLARAASLQHIKNFNFIKIAEAVEKTCYL